MEHRKGKKLFLMLKFILKEIPIKQESKTFRNVDKLIVDEKENKKKKDSKSTFFFFKIVRIQSLYTFCFDENYLHNILFKQNNQARLTNIMDANLSIDESSEEF